MRKSVWFVLLFCHLWTCFANAQPRPTKDGMLFTYTPTRTGITSVALAGSMNNWRKTDAMTPDSAKKVWSITKKLEAGKTYQYKFVLNGELWITDPFAPKVSQDENANGLVTAVELGKPYVFNFKPETNTLSKTLPLL
jgi:1,4-alpha-glucan branching enzyme